MIGDRHHQARFYSDFYRDNYYKMLRWLMISSFIILVLIIANIYYVLLNPPRQYYATTTNGQIIPLSNLIKTQGSS